MKVAWVLNSHGLCSGAITGSPIRFHAVSSRWQCRRPDLEQVLVTTVGGERVLRSVGCTLPVVRLPASLLLKREPFKSKAFRLWSYLVTSLFARLCSFRLPPADVVVTVSDYFCDIVAAEAIQRKRSGTRWIAWIHHKELHPSQRPGNRLFNEVTWRMQEWSFRRIARSADQAWVYDTEAGDLCGRRLVELGMRPERVRKMQNGIDVAPIAAVPAPPKTVDAVMVGVRPNKGSLDVVPIWTHVQSIRPGTTLLLMGGMQGEDALTRHIAQEGLDKVIAVFRPAEGWLPFGDYVQKIKGARLFFAPSHEEGWGIAICEAMACGLPVVVYDLPVYRRIYGEALRVVPMGDHRAFAEAVCRLLDAPGDYSALAERGRTCAGRYDWDRVAEEDLQAVLPAPVR